MKSVHRVARIYIDTSPKLFANWLSRRVWEPFFGQRLAGDDYLPDDVYYYQVSGYSYEPREDDLNGVHRAWLDIAPRWLDLGINGAEVQLKSGRSFLGLPRVLLEIAQISHDRVEVTISLCDRGGRGQGAIEHLVRNLLVTINNVWDILSQLPRDWREPILDEWINDQMSSQSESHPVPQPKKSTSTKYFKNPEDYREVVIGTLEQLIRSGEKDTQQRLAEELSASPAYPDYLEDRTIRDWNKIFGINWRGLQAEARARAR